MAPALHGGVTADRISAFDWSHHPLGPVATWPPSMRTGVRLMLSSRQPMWLGWGSELHVFYNDAFASMLGSREVGALGAPAAKVWSDVWEVLGPRIESVLHTGAATWDESLRLILERGGNAEETYHTLSCSPITDDDGVTGGVLCVTTENTEHVIRERRLMLLDELGSALANVNTEPDLFRILQTSLEARSHDLPFGLVYLFDREGANAILAGSHGVGEHPEFAPSPIAIHAANQPWPAGALLAQSTPVVVGNLDTRTTGLPTGSRDKQPHQALIVRIEEAGKKTPAGFFVAGINPYRPLDSAYTAFIESLAHRIGSAVATIRAGEAERKRADALAELDRAKTAFFGNVSHELRTPLTLLLAPMEELLAASDVAASPHLRELATVAHRNGLRLLKVVNALLDFSRLEAGRMHASFVPTDLAHFTSELASAFRSAVERVGLKFVVDCPPLDDPVFVDRDMWEKIVLNLLSNAFKFTLTGEIRVSLCATSEGIEFSVRDTGVGIPPEARPHLFDRFFRARVNQGRMHEGAGIGLALVHELVKVHQGTLHVESAVGEGTTITVCLRKGRAHLPIDNAPPATPAAASAIPTAPGENQGSPADMIEQGVDETLPDAQAGERGGRVLVVDDNADLRSYVARLLSSHFEVMTAADGISALEIIQASKPDLVLTDAMMPGLDGFGLLRAIRSRPELRTIPVILLSARAGEDSRIEGLDAGADDFLVKPFSGRELLARVKVHVQMARIRGQAEERERELRTRAEVFASALRESSERLSASLAAAGTGTFRWDLRTNLLDFDESLDRLFGLLPGQNARPLAAFLELIHPDDRSRVRAACERCLRVGANFDLEYRITRPDGTVRWLEDKAETFFDEMGKPAYMTGACVDITKRKQAENFVWRQKDVLEQIVQGAPLADVLETLTLDVEQVAERTMIATVLMADATGTQLKPVAGRRCPVGWTQAIEAFPIGPLEGSAGAAAFRKERVIVPDVMTSPLWEKYRLDAVKHGLRACWATPILSSHGTVLGTFAIYHPEPDTPTEDEIRFVDIVTRTAAIAVERDHFEVALNESQAQLAGYAQRLEERVQERTAKLQETVSDLESFSYSISHDMRAPLRAMQSFAQILAEECGDQIGAEGKDYIRRIIGASDRMDRLIQDVLTYSRVTRTELQLEPVNVEMLLDGILESYPQFQPPHARIDVRRPLPRVMANEAGLVQCLSNLIGNAIKFVAPGVVPRVEIWAETAADRVRLFVRDNGIGIEPDAHEKIFNIFYQLDRKYEGTGIGLSVVRKAAERMSGTVGLKSELNRGSTFHLEFARAN